MSEKNHLEELESDPEQKRNKKRSVGMNGELWAGIWISSISLIWLIFSLVLVRTYFVSNLYILGAGILILGLGFIKYYRVKNTDLDF